MTVKPLASPAMDFATPHDEVAEKTLLGAIILDNTVMDNIQGDVTPDDFYVRGHRLIYGAMLSLHQEDVEINPITLNGELKKDKNDHNAGGMAYMSNLTYGVPHFSNPKHFIRLIKRASAQRVILHLAAAIVSQIGDDSDPEDVVTFLDATTDSFRNELTTERAGFRHVLEVAIDVADDLDKLEAGESPGISTGMWALDDATGGGPRPSELWVFAALTGGGKSVLMKQLAHNIAGRGTPVGILTAEMSDKEVLYRLLAPESGVPGWVVNKHLNPSQLQKLRKGLVQVAQLPIWIDDRTTNIFQIASRVRSLVRTQKIEVLFVDYLQLLDVSAEEFGRMVMTRSQEVAKISRTLKRLAKELNIVVIALAQFNRQANAKTDAAGNPVQAEIHHLAESGDLEKDSDLVGIIDMDAYVKGVPERNATIRIGKFRRGPQLSLPYVFNGNYYTFTERIKNNSQDSLLPTEEAPPRGTTVQRHEEPTPEDTPDVTPDVTPEATQPVTETVKVYDEFLSDTNPMF